MPKFSGPMVPTRKHGPVTIINAGLMRTGTLSMTRAYAILGLRAHHGLDIPTEEEKNRQWILFEQAAEATWPDVPGARPRPPFSREDWDQLFVDFDVVTDVAAWFTPQLLEAYGPDVKVVVVEREYEKWLESFEEQVIGSGLFSSPTLVLFTLIKAVTGFTGVDAMHKILYGAFHAKSLKEIRENSRETYDGYYRNVRELVPPERRLEYKLGQGWEPLCEFLGKEVPDVPFPRVNDRQEHKARQLQEFIKMTGGVFRIWRPWIVGLVGLVALRFWWLRR